VKRTSRLLETLLTVTLTGPVVVPGLTAHITPTTIEFSRNLMPKCIYRLVAIAAVLSILACATVALLHTHRDGKLADESHCSICLATHGTTNGQTSPVFTLDVAVATLVFVSFAHSSFVLSPQTHSQQERAPPQL
jgi:hypothetical protein